jgi:hypothetical protein
MKFVHILNWIVARTSHLWLKNSARGLCTGCGRVCLLSWAHVACCRDFTHALRECVPQSSRSMWHQAVRQCATFSHTYIGDVEQKKTSTNTNTNNVSKGNGSANSGTLSAYDTDQQLTLFDLRSSAKCTGYSSLLCMHVNTHYFRVHTVMQTHGLTSIIYLHPARRPGPSQKYTVTENRNQLKQVSNCAFRRLETSFSFLFCWTKSRKLTLLDLLMLPAQQHLAHNNVMHPAQKSRTYSNCDLNSQTNKQTN